MKDIGDWLLEKYGPRLDTGQLADLFRTTAADIRQRISDGTLGIPTYQKTPKRGSPRYADVRDVVEYFNKSRPKVEGPASPDQDGCNASENASPNARTLRRPRVPRNLSQTNGKSPHV